MHKICTRKSKYASSKNSLRVKSLISLKCHSLNDNVLMPKAFAYMIKYSCQTKLSDKANSPSI